jgi:hypothetical protein
MKQYFIIFIFSAFAASISAQSGEETKTIFGNGKPEMGYFLSPSCQIAKFAGSTAVIPGLGAGVIFNKNISLGLVYKLTVTEKTPVGESDNRLYLHGQWGGIKAEYSIRPVNAVHLSFPLEIGVGEIETDLKDSYENQSVTIPAGEAWFANIEPGVALEVNLHKYLKLNLSAGYRLVSDISYRNLTEKNLMGFTSTATLKFGIF